MTDIKATPATEPPPDRAEVKKTEECRHCWGGGAQFRVCILCGTPDKEQREKPQWP